MKTRAVLVFATFCSKTMTVMCHLSMKLTDKFDPNQMYTSDKIVVKHISVKETLLKLDLEHKGQLKA